MQLFRFRHRSIESTIRTSIILIVTGAVVFLAALAGKLALDAEHDTLEEMSSLSLASAETQLQRRVGGAIRDFEKIAAAPVLSAALMDTIGRESYLAPFLAQRTDVTGMIFGFYDYRGRLLLRTGAADAPIGEPRLTARVLALRASAGRIELEAPIYFPGDERPIGFLVGSIPDDLLLADAGMSNSRFFTAQVRFDVMPSFAPERGRVLLYTGDDAVLVAKIGDVEAVHWLEDTLEKLAVMGAIATIAVLLAGALLARLTASAISQPINQLTGAVAQLRIGSPATPPRDLPRELETLGLALFEAFEERDAALRQLQNIAHYDALTATLSRAYFDQQARASLGRADRKGGAATLLYLDLDRFKEINDTYGHDAGDRLLAAVCDRIRGRLRIRDLVGRRGGDEFVILLAPLSEPGDIGTVCWDLARLITAPVEVLPGVSVCVGVSMGAATYPHDGHDYEQLMTSADTAMYEAKKAGRGRVAFASGKVVSLSLSRWPEQEARVG